MGKGMFHEVSHAITFAQKRRAVCQRRQSFLLNLGWMSDGMIDDARGDDNELASMEWIECKEERWGHGWRNDLEVHSSSRDRVMRIE